LAIHCIEPLSWAGVSGNSLAIHSIEPLSWAGVSGDSLAIYCIEPLSWAGLSGDSSVQFHSSSFLALSFSLFLSCHLLSLFQCQ
jgi:hypothetical protein